MRLPLLFLVFCSFVLAFYDEAAWVKVNVTNRFGEPIEGVVMDICCYTASVEPPYFACTYLGESNKDGIVRSICKSCQAGEMAEVRAYYGAGTYSSYFKWSGAPMSDIPIGCHTKDPAAPHHTTSITVDSATLRVIVKDGSGKPLSKIPIAVDCASFVSGRHFENVSDENGTAIIKFLPKHTNCTITTHGYGLATYRKKMVFTLDEETLEIIFGEGEKSSFVLSVRLENNYGSGLDGDARIYAGSLVGYINITNGKGEISLPNGTYKVKVFYFNRLIEEKNVTLDKNTELAFVVAESNCGEVKNLNCSHDYKYCYFGVLKDNCKKCGCEPGYYCDEREEIYGGVCCKVGTYYNGKKCVEGKERFNIFYVPINRPPDDPEFLSVVVEQGKFISHNYKVPMDSIKIVDETMDVTSDSCGFLNRVETLSIDMHFKSWYAKKTGYINSIFYNQYRVVGYDRFDTCSKDECGHALRSIVPAAYLNGVWCAKFPHISAHEIGHTFGLCDTYNPNLWASQNSLLLPCPNAAPSPENSECVNCPPTGVCCYGIKLGEYTYDIMGSADVETPDRVVISRKFTDQEDRYIQNILEGMR